MNLDAEQLTRLGAETGFRPDTLEKVIRLGELAADIGRHPLLSRVLALKGGTALNLLFGPPARLSVDLDYNYIGEADRGRMLDERPQVEQAIERLGKGQGYRVQRSRDEHAGRKVYLSYVNAAGTRDRIEVDLNFLYRVPLGEVAKRSMWQPPGVARPDVFVVPEEELFTGKIRATLDRAMPRDLFDTVRLPDHAGPLWSSQRLRRIHVASAITLPHPLYDYQRNRFDRITDKQIQEQLAPTLHMNAQPTAAELKEEAWAILEPFTNVDEVEREYLDRASIGELHPELLFPDDEETANLLRHHPALLWKIENVKRHRSS